MEKPGRSGKDGGASRPPARHRLGVVWLVRVGSLNGRGSARPPATAASRKPGQAPAPTHPLTRYPVPGTRRRRPTPPIRSWSQTYPEPPASRPPTSQQDGHGHPPGRARRTGPVAAQRRAPAQRPGIRPHPPIGQRADPRPAVAPRGQPMTSTHYLRVSCCALLLRRFAARFGPGRWPLRRRASSPT